MREYHDALRIIALHWGGGPYKPGTPLPAHILQAYRTVGRFAGRHHAPRHGVAHPEKSIRRRLKNFLFWKPTLPPGCRIVTRTIQTRSRSWSTAWLEFARPGVVTRYRAGLRGPTISIRGTTPGLGSAAANPCPWRPLSKKERSSLHPTINAFLDALAGRPE